MTNLSSAKMKLNRWIEVITDTLTNTEPARVNLKSGNRDHSLPITYFSPVYPVDFEIRCASPSSPEMLVFADAKPADVGNWDMSVISLGKEEGVRFHMTRFKRMWMCDLRGTKIISNWIGEIGTGIIEDEDKLLTARSLLAWREGRWWQTYKNCQMPWKPLPDNDEIAQAATISIGLQFTRYYEWTVILGRENCLKYQLVTDPEGAKAIFRLRDFPAGTERRAALRNWISEHWRQNRGGDGIKVREHLRGATEFKWNGLEVQIVPSEYDVKRNDLLQERRDAERAQIKQWATSRYGKEASGWS